MLRKRSDYFLPWAALGVLYLAAIALNSWQYYRVTLAVLAVGLALIATRSNVYAAILAVGASCIDAFGIFLDVPRTVTVFQVVLIGGLAGFIWRLWRDRSQLPPRFTWWDVGVVTLLLAALVSVASGLFPGRSTIGAAEVAFLTGMYFLVSRAGQDPRDFGAIVDTVIFAGTVSALVALSQITGDFGLVPLLENHPTGSAVVPLRVTGFFGNPNTLAVLLVLAYLLALARSLKRPDIGRRLAYLAPAFICLAAIAASYSRQAYVGVVIGSGFLLAAVVTRRRRVLAAAAGLAAIALVLVFATGVGGRAASILQPASDTSSMARVHLARASARAFAERPVTGLGVSAFGASSERYVDPSIAGEWITDPHQMPVGILAEMGILGLLAEVCFTVCLAMLVLAALRAETKPSELAAPVAVALAFFAMSFFNWFLFFESLWTTLGIVGAACLSGGHLMLKRNPEATRTLRRE